MKAQNAHDTLAAGVVKDAPHDYGTDLVQDAIP